MEYQNDAVQMHSISGKDHLCNLLYEEKHANLLFIYRANGLVAIFCLFLKSTYYN